MVVRRIAQRLRARAEYKLDQAIQNLGRENDIMSGLVPIGDTGLYRTPDEPADPTDCSRYPDSPFCGGMPFTISPIGIDFEIINDGCNLGIKLSPALAFIRLPPIAIVYRKKECRNKKDIPPELASNASYCIPFECKGQYLDFVVSGTAYPITAEDVESGLFPGAIPFLEDGSGFAGRPVFLRLTSSMFILDPSVEVCFYRKNPSTVAFYGTGNYTYVNGQFIHEYLNDDNTTGVFSVQTYEVKMHRTKNTAIPFFHFTDSYFKYRWWTDFKVESISCRLSPPPPPDDECAMKECCPCDDTLTKALLKKVNKLYAILGGNVWQENGAAVKLNKNLESDIKSKGSNMFGEDFAKNETVTINNLIEYITYLIAVNYHRAGLHEYPASLPASLISKDEGFLGNLIPNENESIPNLTQLLAKFIKYYDELMGQWEIAIEVKDSDPSTPGDQPKGVKLPNMAEAIAEMFSLAFQTNINSETLLNIATRNLIETGTDKQQNFISYKLLESISDYLGFKQKDIQLEMPLMFTPEKTRYDELLQESKVKVGVVEFDEKFGLEADLMRLRKVASILDSVYFRKINPNADIQAQILSKLLERKGKIDKINDEDSDTKWEEFLRQVEEGYGQVGGVTNPTQPYGREYSERPKLRDLTDLNPQEP